MTAPDSVVLLSKLTELSINFSTELEKLLPVEFFVREIYNHYTKSGSFLASLAISDTLQGSNQVEE